MTRAFAFLAAATLLSWATAAQDKPAGPLPDPAVAADLRAAKDAYRAEVEKATEAFLGEFAAEEKRVTESTKLKIDDKIQRAEQLQAEKKAFAADGKMPRSPGMKVASADYQAKSSSARVRCEKAFDRAAEAAGKTDLAAAKAVLLEKVEFFKPAPPPGTAKAGPAVANPLVGTWERAGAKAAMHKHVTPTHFMIAYADPAGRVVLTHGGKFTVKNDTAQESIDYGFGSGWDALKNRVVTYSFKVQGKRWTVINRTGEEVWDLVEPK